MSKFETFADLKTAALQRSGELTNGNSDYDTIVEEQMNNLLRSIFAGGNEFSVDLAEPWEWAKGEFSGVLTLIPPFETGTASVSQGSTSVTLSADTTGYGSFRGHYFIVDGHPTIYRINQHTDGQTSLALDQAYLEDTSATASFKIVKLDYEILPQGYFDSVPVKVERLVGPMRVYKANNVDSGTLIEGLDTNAFEKKYPRSNLIGGIPENFMVSHEINGVQTVRFSHYQVEDKLRVEYDYIPIAPHQCIVTFDETDLVLSKMALTGEITAANHGLSEGQPIMLTSTGTLPDGWNLETIYYAWSVSADSFSIKEDRNSSTTLIPSDTGSTDAIHKISTIPPIPHSYRKVLFYAATHFVMIDKSDSRSDYYMRLTQATLQALVNANRKQKRHTSVNRGRLITRPDQIPTLINRSPRVFD